MCVIVHQSRVDYVLPIPVGCEMAYKVTRSGEEWGEVSDKNGV